MVAVSSGSGCPAPLVTEAMLISSSAFPTVNVPDLKSASVKPASGLAASIALLAAGLNSTV